MEIDLCTLADYARPGEGGKLNIMGVFDHLRAKEFPVRHQSMVIVMRLLAESSDSESDFTLLVRLQKPDGGNIFEANGQVAFGTVDPGQFATKNVVMQLNGVPFETSGNHLVQVFVDGELEAEKRLRVVQIG